MGDKELDIDGATAEIAKRYGVPDAVWRKMRTQESGGNPDAVSPKGATSAWQIMPKTAKGLGIDPRDPLQAAEGGLRILRDNYKQFRPYAKNEKHAWMMAVAGYHGSPQNVLKDLKAGGYGLPNISDGAITTRDHVLKIFDGISGAELGGGSSQQPQQQLPDYPQSDFQVGGYTEPEFPNEQPTQQTPPATPVMKPVVDYSQGRADAVQQVQQQVAQQVQQQQRPRIAPDAPKLPAPDTAGEQADIAAIQQRDPSYSTYKPMLAQGRPATDVEQKQFNEYDKRFNQFLKRKGMEKNEESQAAFNDELKEEATRPVVQPKAVQKATKAPVQQLVQTGKVKVGDRELVEVESDDLPETKKRVKDLETNETYIVDTKSGTIDDESLKQTAETVQFNLVPYVERYSTTAPEVARKRQAFQIADQLAPKYGIAKQDVVSFLEERGFTDEQTGKPISDERLYTDREGRYKTDTYSITRRDLADLIAASKEAQKKREDWVLDQLSKGVELDNKTLQDMEINLSDMNKRRYDEIEMARTKGIVAKEDFEKFKAQNRAAGQDEVTATVNASARVGRVKRDFANKILEQYEKDKADIAKFRADEREGIKKDLQKDKYDAQMFALAGVPYTDQSEVDKDAANISEADIDRELRIRALATLTEQEKRTAAEVGENSNILMAGLRGGAGRNKQFVAGMIRPFAELAPSLYSYLSKQGQMNVLAEQANAETWKGESSLVRFGAGAARMAGASPFDISRIMLLSRTGMGNVATFAVDSALMSAGRGENLEQITKNAATGAAMGFVLSGASRLAQGVYSVAARQGIRSEALKGLFSGEVSASTERAAQVSSFIRTVLTNPSAGKEAGQGAKLLTGETMSFPWSGKTADRIAKGVFRQFLSEADLAVIASKDTAAKNWLLTSKVLGEGVRVGTIGAGTFGLQKAEGASDEEALHAAASMVLFDIAMSAKDYSGVKALAGKIFRAKNGEKVGDYTVDAEGNLRSYGKVDDAVVDVFLDGTEGYKNAKNVTPTVEPKVAEKPVVETAEKPVTPKPVVETPVTPVAENAPKVEPKPIDFEPKLSDEEVAAIEKDVTKGSVKAKAELDEALQQEPVITPADKEKAKSVLFRKKKVANEESVEPVNETPKSEPVTADELKAAPKADVSEVSPKNARQAEKSDTPALPKVVDNYRKPLSTYAPKLYRETNLDAVTELLTTNSTAPTQLYFANTPNLAKGQGDNVGVMVQFKSGDIEGQINTSKPSWETAYENGEVELIGKHNSQRAYADAIESITIMPNAKGQRAKKVRLMRYLEQNGWVKESIEGGVKFTRPTQENAPTVKSDAVTDNANEREGWQLTSAEFTERTKAQRLAEADQLEKEIAEGKYSRTEQGQYGTKTLDDGVAKQRALDKVAELRKEQPSWAFAGEKYSPHWIQVRNALEDGETVPANVLAEYPDLEAQAKELNQPDPISLNAPVTVNGKGGKVTKITGKRIQVTFEDGSKKTVTAKDVLPKSSAQVDESALLQNQSAEGKTEAKVKQPLRQISADAAFEVGQAIRSRKPIDPKAWDSLTLKEQKAFEPLIREYSRPALSDEPPAPVRVLKSKGNLEVVDSEFRSTDADDDYYYHITPTKNVPSILAKGILPTDKSKFGGVYEQNSKGKAFVTERSGVPFWQGAIENALFHSTGEDGATAVIRIPKTKAPNVELDALGTQDAKSRAYSSSQPLRRIPDEFDTEAFKKERDSIPLVKDKEGNLLAPNGKKSNLPEKLWQTVRTPSFKKFFGEWETDPENASKIVDSNGEPLVVYHGAGLMPDTISAFLPFSHFGTFESANDRLQAREADGYPSGGILPVFLNIRTPLRLTDREANDDAVINRAIKQGRYSELAPYWKDAPAGVYAMQQAGYDGIVYENRIEDIGKDSYINFQPNQIKSIFNRGSFDESPNILRNIPAWHGSPHVFDKFSLEKLGTGEGAQAYGHGLYFTDSESIADYYREVLSKSPTPLLSNLVPEIGKNISQEAYDFLRNYGDVDSAIEGLRNTANSVPDWIKKAWAGREAELEKLHTSYRAAADWIEANKARLELRQNEGAKYKVTLAPKQEELLDWDKPFTEQSKFVKERLKKAGVLRDYNANLSDFTSPMITRNRNKRGENMYQFLEHQLGSPKAASDYLKSLGIRGARYLDGSSRNKGRGKYNYVIYDDADVSINAVLRRIADNESPDAKAYQEKLKETENVLDLLPDVVAKADGDMVKLSLEASELIRASNALKTGAAIEDEPIIGGQFLDPDEIKTLTKNLKTFAEIAKDEGIDATPINNVISALKDAAKDNGTVMLNVYDDAIRHERIHQQSYLGAAEKALSKRVGDARKFAKDNEATLEKVRGFFERNGYVFDRDISIIVEETATYIADNDHRRLGLTDDEAADYIYNWFKAYQNANGKDSLDRFREFVKGTGLAERAIEEIYGENRKLEETDSGVQEQPRPRQGEGGNTQSAEEGSGREGGKRSTDAPAPSSTEKGSQARNEGGSTKGSDSEQEGRLRVKASKTPQTLRANGIEVDDRYYVPVHNADQQAYADKKLGEGEASARKAFEQAVEDNDYREGATTAIAIALMNHYGQTGDVKALNEVADKLVPMLREAGQAIQAVKLIQKYNPATAAAYTAKLLKQYTGRDLTEFEAKRATSIAQRVQDAAKREGELEAQLAKAQSEKDALKAERDALEKAYTAASDEKVKLDVKIGELGKKVTNLQAQVRRAKADKPKTTRIPVSKFVREIEKELPDLEALVKGAFGQQPLRNIPAWHGSPYVFDKFSLNKIGTGEGAQAYGYGLYFTDRESIADFYREALSEVKYISNGGELGGNEAWAAQFLHSFEDVKKPTRRSLTDAIERISEVIQDSSVRNEAIDFAKKLDKAGVSVEQGVKYKVTLAPKENELLLWDKPLSEQSDVVRNGLQQINIEDFANNLEDITGEELYKELQNSLSSGLKDKRNELRIQQRMTGSADEYHDLADQINALETEIQSAPAKASEYLKSLGIRGIKFLDGTSRRRGEGSYNYVIFDDADVEINQILRQIPKSISPEVEEALVKLTALDIANGEKFDDVIANIEKRTNGMVDAEQARDIQAKAVEKLRSKSEPTDEAKQKIEDAKVKAKIRKEHYALADEYLYQKNASAEEKAFADFAKSLTNSKTSDALIRTIAKLGVKGYSPEAITSALLRKSKNVGDVVAELKKQFPNLTPNELRKVIREGNELFAQAKKKIGRERIRAKSPEALTDEQIDRIEREKSANQKEKAAAMRESQAFYDSLIKSNTQAVIEGAVNFRKANLLSNPKTHIKNLFGNLFFGMTEEVARGIASGADMAAQLVTGRRAMQGISGKGMANGFKSLLKADDGMKNVNKKSGIEMAKRILSYGGDIEDMEHQQLMESHLGEKFGKVGGVFDAYINTTFRALSSVDALFKVYAFRRSLEEQASVAAKNGKGKREDLLLNPTPIMVQIAEEYALEQTFNNENVISSWISAAKNWATRKSQYGYLAKAVWEILVPFDRTPTNVMLRVFDYTPVGLVKAGVAGFRAVKKTEQVSKDFSDKYRKNVEKTVETEADFAALPKDEQRKRVEEEMNNLFSETQQRQFAKLFGRSTFGTGLMALGYFLAQAGALIGGTSADSDDNDEKSLAFSRMKTGKKAGMLKIGDTYIALPDTPAAKAMTMGATAFEQSALRQNKAELIKDIPAEVIKRQKGNGKDMMSAVTTGLMESAKDAAFEQPLARQTRELFASRRTAGGFLGNLVGSFVPVSGLLRSTADAIDDKARRSSGYSKKEQEGKSMTDIQTTAFKEQLRSGLPFLRQMNPETKLAVPQEERGGFGRRLVRQIDPFNVTSNIVNQEDEINKEAFRKKQEIVAQVRSGQISKQEASKQLAELRRNGMLSNRDANAAMKSAGMTATAETASNIPLSNDLDKLESFLKTVKDDEKADVLKVLRAKAFRKLKSKDAAERGIGKRAMEMVKQYLK